VRNVLLCLSALAALAPHAAAHPTSRHPELLKAPIRGRSLNGRSPHVALLLGTFDPFHEDHFKIAALGRGEGADEVLVVPTFHPAHKPGATPIERRLDMITMRIQEEAGINLFRGDASRYLRLGQDALVAHVKSLYRTDDVTIYVGQDAYEEGLRRWGIAPDIAYRYRVVPRGRGAAPPIPDAVRDKVSVVPGGPLAEHSSTEIRERVRTGRPLVPGAVAPAIERYIRDHALYRAPVAEKVQ
jgi:nicotinic acid mononucleotide adenylyltransferase